MSAGPNPAVRDDDGRLLRSTHSRRSLAGAVLDGLIDKGEFQPKIDTIVAVTETWRSSLSQKFGSRRLFLNHLARIAPGRVVDAIGLSPEGRAALSDRDERAIAMAVLGGRRLERGE